MIPFSKTNNEYVLELGGGSSPHPLSDVRVDQEAIPGISHFTVDFSKSDWPEIGSGAFDAVLCQNVSFLVSGESLRNFLQQINRVLKPSGKVLVDAVNTERNSVTGAIAQFGPAIASRVFSEAGFVNVLITPYNQNEMLIEAKKPIMVQQEVEVKPEQKPSPQPVTTPTQESKPASEIYNQAYFENYQGQGFAWDYPQHYLIAQKILDKQPESVLELGCARGYILKKIQDAGILCQGIDISKHAWMTRVCDPINVHDLTQTPWPLGKQEFDLAYSISLLEHIPESCLTSFVDELQRVSKRGLHAVALEGQAPTHDSTRCTLKNLDYWRRLMPEGHEVVDIREIQAGTLPAEYLQGEIGKVKLNIGCAFTMYHQGWLNVDVIDVGSFPNTFHYAFLRHDVRNGIPYGTGTVSCIFAHHMLEHLTYEEIARFLKESRRVIRPDGCMRIVVPNTEWLTGDYHNLPGLKEYDEMNLGCSKAPTFAGKLWALLAEGHKSFLDQETLQLMLEEAGWNYHKASFRHTEVPIIQQVLRETTEMPYNNSSLFADATPKRA